MSDLPDECQRPTFVYLAGVEGASHHGVDALLPFLNMAAYRSLPFVSEQGPVCFRLRWTSYPSRISGMDEGARLSLLFGDSCEFMSALLRAYHSFRSYCMRLLQ